MAFRFPGSGLPNWQEMDRDIDRAIDRSKALSVFTVATVPDPAAYPYTFIYVSDETGGAQPAFSDGTNWRRLTDRAIVS